MSVTGKRGPKVKFTSGRIVSDVVGPQKAKVTELRCDRAFEEPEKIPDRILLN